MTSPVLSQKTCIGRRDALILMFICLFLASTGSAADNGTQMDTYTTGEMIQISGTTNLAAGNELTITIVSLSFQPTAKERPSGFSGTSGVATVVEEGGRNIWSFTFDSSGFMPDEYLVTIESVETGQQMQMQFLLLEEAQIIPDTSTKIPSSIPLSSRDEEVQKTPGAPGFGWILVITGLALALICARR
ncbi:hypothetical protein FTO68_03760 [Methanocalculus taiwanensis]|uniref:Uncharacterized protein n=1 Tax=Methanocalculus taiwanensis TaxID=106207 RepID=A0ABD4TGK6_9EURY|nr:hypothetical protein [Methanocalculus taiwanensis]MCQ1538108.1 hypothetical protein [Methanocalculus taiwanensis]